MNKQAPQSAFRVIAVSVPSTHIEHGDGVAHGLRAERCPLANRSLVIRDGLACLADDVATRTAEDIFRYVVDRRGRRILRWVDTTGSD